MFGFLFFDDDGGAVSGGGLELLQQGYRDEGDWLETGLRINECANRVAGLLFGGATLGESRLLSATLSFEIQLTAGQVPVTLSIYAHAGAISAPWSDDNLPPFVREIGTLSDFLVATVTLTAAGSYTVEVDLDLPALDAARFIGWTPESPWDGRFAFHIHGCAPNEADMTLTMGSPVFALTQTTRVFTGIEIGGPLTKMSSSRPDICPICGTESLREEWVFCALHSRLECALCADPDDVPRRLGPSRNMLVNDEG